MLGFKSWFEHSLAIVKEKPYCYACMSSFTHLDVAHHVSQEEHLNNRKGIFTKQTTKTLESVTEQYCELLVNNGIVCKKNEFKCLYCLCSISSIVSVSNHMNGKRHVETFYRKRKKINPNEKSNAVTTADSPNANSLMKMKNTFEKINSNLQPISNDRNDSEEQLIEIYYCELCDLQVNAKDIFDHVETESHFKIAIAKGIIDHDNHLLFKDYVFNCILCKCIMQTLVQLALHLSNAIHKHNASIFMNKQFNERLNNYTENCKEIYEVADMSICYLLKKNRSDLCNFKMPYLDMFRVISWDQNNKPIKEIKYTCLVCNNTLTEKTVGVHVKSKKHHKQLHSINNSGIVSSLDYKSKNSDISSSLVTTLENSDIPSSLVTKLENTETILEYECNLCNTRVEKEDILKHVNTKEHSEKFISENNSTSDQLCDKISFSCIFCKKIIQGNKSFVEHIQHKEHKLYTVDFLKRYINGNYMDKQKIHKITVNEGIPLCNLICFIDKTVVDFKEKPLIRIAVPSFILKLDVSSKKLDENYVILCSLCYKRKNKFNSIRGCSEHFQGKKHISNLKKICANSKSYTDCSNVQAAENIEIKEVNSQNIFININEGKKACAELLSIKAIDSDDDIQILNDDKSSVLNEQRVHETIVTNQSEFSKTFTSLAEDKQLNVAKTLVEQINDMHSPELQFNNADAFNLVEEINDDEISFLNEQRLHETIATNESEFTKTLTSLAEDMQLNVAKTSVEQTNDMHSPELQFNKADASNPVEEMTNSLPSVSNNHIIKDDFTLRSHMLFNCTICQSEIKGANQCIEHLSMSTHNVGEFTTYETETKKLEEMYTNAGNSQICSFRKKSVVRLPCYLVVKGYAESSVVKIPYIYFHLGVTMTCKNNKFQTKHLACRYVCALCITLKQGVKKHFLKHLYSKEHTKKLEQAYVNIWMEFNNIEKRISERLNKQKNLSSEHINHMEEEKTDMIQDILNDKITLCMKNSTSDTVDGKIFIACVSCKAILVPIDAVRHFRSGKHKMNTLEFAQKYIEEEYTNQNSINKICRGGGGIELFYLIRYDKKTASKHVKPLLSINLTIDCLHLGVIKENQCYFLCHLCKEEKMIFSYHAMAEHMSTKKHCKKMGKMHERSKWLDPVSDDEVSDDEVDKESATMKEVSLNNSSQTKNKDKRITSLRPAIDKQQYTNNLVIPSDVYEEITNSLMKPPLSYTNYYRKQGPPTGVHSFRYNRTYLELEKDIYKCDSSILKDIESSCKISIFNLQEKTAYCIACNETVKQNLYEHMRSANHLVAMQNARIFQLVHIMGANVNCYACNKQIKYKIRDERNRAIEKTANIHIDEANINDCEITSEETALLHHVNQLEHVNNYEKCYDLAMKQFKELESKLMNCWYVIQRYSCALCCKKFDFKVDFIRHIHEKRNKHENGMTKNIYDFCMSCGILWLGNKDTYRYHAMSKSHKYIVQNNEFEVRKISKRTKNLLLDYAEIVDNLFQYSEKVLAYEYDDLHALLKRSLTPLFDHTIKLHFFGSRINGLGTLDSDIDIFVDCDSYYGNTMENMNINKVMENVEMELMQDEDEWEVQRLILTARTPIIKCLYKKMGLECDISFKNGLSVENTYLIRAYNLQYPNCRKLNLFLKKWLSSCNLPGPNAISNYGLTWKVIFYLQQRKIVHPVAKLLEQQSILQQISDWKTCFKYDVNVINTETSDTLGDLLVGFFKYYGEFDYRHDVICPLTGKLVKKADFAQPETLPKEMYLYVEYIRTTERKSVEHFRIDSAMCVQDPYDLSYNITRAVLPFTVNSFKQCCKESAEFLENLRINNTIK